MRTTIMPSPIYPEPPIDLFEDRHLSPLGVLGITDATDLFAAELEGETEEEAAARQQAAGDILDGRLAEIAHQTLTAQVIRGWAL